MFRQNPNGTTFTIDAADVAQTIIAANGSRTKLRINNNSFNKFPLFVQFGAAATHDSYSQIIMPGGVYESPVDQCPLEYVSVLSELTGHAFDVLEYSSGNITFASLADRPSAADFGVGVCQVGADIYISDGAAWALVTTSDNLTFTSGSILFADTDGSVTEDNTNFFFDNTNNSVKSGSLQVMSTTMPSGGYGVAKSNASSLGLFSNGTLVGTIYQGTFQLDTPTGIGRIIVKNNGNHETAIKTTATSGSSAPFSNDQSVLENNAAAAGMMLLCRNAAPIKFTINDVDVGSYLSDGSGFSFTGNSAKVHKMDRHTTANTAGNSLTITAGGATSAATDKNGGQLIMRPGLSTGTGEAGVTLQGVVAGSTGTADNLYQDVLKILGNKWALNNATPTATQTGYSTSNVTTSRTLDANTALLSEVADVLCTLIEDLKTKGIIGA